MKLLQFSLRDWFWLTLVIAMSFGWYYQSLGAIRMNNYHNAVSTQYENAVHGMAKTWAREKNGEVQVYIRPVLNGHRERTIYAYPDGYLSYEPRLPRSDWEVPLPELSQLENLESPPAEIPELKIPPPEIPN